MFPLARIVAAVVAVMTFFAMPAGVALASSIGPGPVPPQCSDDPQVLAAGGVPGAGLLGPAPGGCLIQSGEAGFTLSPHVLQVGDVITGTVIPESKPDDWSWGSFEEIFGAGARHPLSACPANTTSCSVRVGDNVSSTRYQVYSQAISVPVVGGIQEGAVSSDYFIVDNDLYTVSGTVTDNSGAPVSGVPLEITGNGGSEPTSTDANGDYSLPVMKGSYQVQVTGPQSANAQPHSRNVSVSGNISGVDFQVGCRIDETIDGWKFEGDCPPADDPAAGATMMDVTPPSGSPVSIEPGEGGPDPWPLPVLDASDLDRLFEPVVLPDLDLPGIKLVECTIDSDGVEAGQASIDFGLVSGIAEDLTFSPDMRSGSAGFLELQLDGLSLEASNVAYSDGTFKAGTFELGLPGALGGDVVSGEGLEVGPQGVSGTISGAFKIADLTVDITKAGLDHDDLVIGSAKVVLPAYLSSTKLQASGLRYDLDTGHLTGTVKGNIPTLKLGVLGQDLTLSMGASLKFDTGDVDAANPGDPNDPPSYTIAGDGKLDVKSDGKTVLGIDTAFELASVWCAPAPPGGPCLKGHAPFLHSAKLFIKHRPIPIPDTGLVLTGSGGGVSSTETDNPTISPDGTVNGVTYTFDLNAGLASQIPGLFKGTAGWAMSTGGNLAAKLNATILNYVDFDGEICMINNSPDDVCHQYARPGYYFGGTLSTSASGKWGPCTGSAAFKGTLDGEFVHSGVLGYAEANGMVNFSGNLTCGSIEVLHADATAQGRLGYFRAPNGHQIYGIRLYLEYTKRIGSSTTTGMTSILLKGDHTVDPAGNLYTEIPGTTDAIQGTGDVVDVTRRGSRAGDPYEAVPIAAGTSASPESRSAAAGQPGTSSAQPTLVPPRVPGQSGCAVAVKLLAVQARAQAAANLLPDPAVRFPDQTAGKPAIPTFTVNPRSTPCIAANDAAAIDGFDPSTGSYAVTVDRSTGGYIQYTAQPQFDKLTVTEFSGNENWEDHEELNRKAACGKDPFFTGNTPGPTDLADIPFIQSNSRSKKGFFYWSCDEYPFASTNEGGSAAIIRGVELDENNKQGGDLSAFYIREANALDQNQGQFYVYVVGLTVRP